MSQGFNVSGFQPSISMSVNVSISVYFNVSIFQFPLPGGRHKCIVPFYIVLLYTIISTKSKRKATDLVAYLNYVPPKIEKHFWLSLETGVDLIKRQYCKRKQQFLSSKMSRFHVSLSSYFTFFWISLYSLLLPRLKLTGK